MKCVVCRAWDVSCSGVWQLNVVPVANSRCGGFGSVCRHFISVCLSLEAKSVRLGTAVDWQVFSVHTCWCFSVGVLNNVYVVTPIFHTCASVDEDISVWSQVYEFVEKRFL